MPTPEDKARENIDDALEKAGWKVQDYKNANFQAGRGIALRNFPLTSGHGFADYMLYVDGKAAGVVEAKKEGITLTGVEVQAAKYSQGLPRELPAHIRPLPFLYQSTGVETRFTNGLDPEPRSRQVFSFHRPDNYAKETLRLPGYVRYVDDFLAFSNDKGQLHAAQEAMATYCEGLRLTLHPRKCFVAPVTVGFTFLGYRIFPSHRRVEADNVRRFKRRVRDYLARVLRGQLAVAKARNCVQSWLAHAGHANTSRLRGLLREGFERVWPGVHGRVARGVGRLR